MSTKAHLKRKIAQLLDGEEAGDSLTIIYHNPVTGVAEILYQSPAVTSLQIEVDDPKTGQTFLKLRNHEQTAGSQKQG
jgi:hypothetical protein